MRTAVARLFLPLDDAAEQSNEFVTDLDDPAEESLRRVSR
jgi:hypothetical protein